MQRSRTQVLYHSFLPESVFVHESGIIVRSAELRGDQLTTNINKAVLLREIDEYLRGWTDENRVGIPLPSSVPESEFLVITPELIRWDIWPLVFECSRETCLRIHRFRNVRDIQGHSVCGHCGGRLRQLRYFSAHACGARREMFVPECSVHGYSGIYLQDTGTFRTSTFRCRDCGGAVIQRTAFTPCGCRSFPDPTGRSVMRAYTVRDTRSYYPHYISLINLQSTLLSQLQAHPRRGEIAIGSYLGLVARIGDALNQADRAAGPSTRLSSAEWATQEARYRELGLSPNEIEILRQARGPETGGVGAVANLDPAILAIGASRRLVERALLFEQEQVRRITLADSEMLARTRGVQIAADALSAANQYSQRLGIDELSVTWNFPIATAAFGYTRGSRLRGEGRICGFAQRDKYDGKTPIFAVETETEAVLVTLSAHRIIRWLAHRGEFTGDIPGSARDAKETVLRIFAQRTNDPTPAASVTTLIHSMSHCLLRALEDGQSGFAESSLAEWLVPETLTFAIYANSLKSYTLGALWTLINNRTIQWLQSARESSWLCENDPLCYQTHPRACERCLYITFGCEMFNDNLDRQLLTQFWTLGEENSQVIVPSTPLRSR